MKIEIFEPYYGGHYTEFVAHLLPSLKKLLLDGAIDSVVISTSRQHLEHPHFADIIAPLAEGIEIDASFSIGDYGPNSAAEIAGLLHESVRRNRPDVVISTTADYGMFVLALRSLVIPSYRFPDVKMIGIAHHGFARAPRGMREWLKAGVQRFARDASPWDELHFINPYLFRRIVGDVTASTPRMKSVPNPVRQGSAMTKSRARESLRIPVVGRYIGHVGGVDARMALPELVTAFRAASSEVTDRLLIAGKLYPPYRRYVSDTCEDLIRSGRMIALDRYLSSDEMNAANNAIDVAAITYYPAEQLSGKLLQAIVTRRPVIANRCGYTAKIIADFNVGWACDVLDQNSFRETVGIALANADGFATSEKIDRFIDYHDPENYSRSVLASVYAKLGIETVNDHNWDWVERGDIGESR